MNERELLDLEMAAYQRAWTAISQDKEMTPDEREFAPRLLRAKILRLINEGQRDAAHIALEAYGRLSPKGADYALHLSRAVRDDAESGLNNGPHHVCITRHT